MKNFKLLLATAVLFAVGSAFASTNSKVEDLWVRNSNGTYQLKGDGICNTQVNETCSYHRIDPQGPNDDSNFSAAEAGQYTP